jgi:precorrin-3B synthase
MSELNRKARGYCPGVWTPMPSGDGLIVRVRPHHARMPAAHLGELARLARDCGNGIIELTRRGNLQIRGVSASSWPRLSAALVELGLAGAGPESEARPVLYVCPLSGLDPRCPPLEPLADALDELLSTVDMGRRLPDKFSLVLGGGSQSSSELSADVHVRLHPAHPDVADLLVAGSVIASGVITGGVIAGGGNSAEATPLGACPTSDVVNAVRRLLLALDAFPSERRRMRDAVAADLDHLRRSLEPLGLGPARREAAWGSPEVGYHTGTVDWFGFALPFGSANADAWAAIARSAERLGTGEVRFTPTRHVLVSGVRPSDREALVEFGQRRSLGVRRPTRTIELVACSGSPACGSAQGETRELARRLGKLLDGSGRAPTTLHVSGCEKSCARDEAADVTLVHTADGLRLGFGRDVRGTLAAPPLSLDSVRRQLVERFMGERPHQHRNPPFAGSPAESAAPIEAGAGESPR